MHIPSERVRKQMLFEPSYLWFVPSEGNDTHAVLIKTSGNILRSIVSGVKVELFCAVNELEAEKYLCLALRIYDDAVHPTVIFKIQTDEEEHSAFWEVLKRRDVPIFFFDELCQCIGWTQGQFGDGISEALNLINSPKTLYTGKFNKNALHSMDCIDFTMDPTRQLKGATTIHTVDLGIKLNNVESWSISNPGISDNHEFHIKINEGQGFEQRVWTALESIFPFGIYKSPQSPKGSGVRELIDVLCLSEHSMLLVEAKTLSIFEGKTDKDMKKKVLRLQKHIDKGLNQLEGALKHIRSGGNIFEKKSNKSKPVKPDIKFTENQIKIPQAIVVVSELLSFGDWSGYFERIMQLSKDNHALFQIIDLPELMKIIIASSGSSYDFETMANAFDYHLSERFDGVVKNQNIFTRLHFR